MPPLKGFKRSSDVETSTNGNNILLPSFATNLPEVGQQFRSKCYASKVLGNLSELRRNSRFCDIEITAGGKVVKVSLLSFYIQ